MKATAKTHGHPRSDLVPDASFDISSDEQRQMADSEAHEFRGRADGSAEAFRARHVRVASQAFEYPAVAVSCTRARLDVAGVLFEVGLGADAIETAQLVASELFTNALIHHAVAEGETVGLVISTVPRLGGGVWVVLSVVDAGDGALLTGSGEPDDDEHGRGLTLIRGLGADVGGRAVPNGYRVRARFPAVADSAVRATPTLIADQHAQGDPAYGVHACCACK